MSVGKESSRLLLRMGRQLPAWRLTQVWNREREGDDLEVNLDAI